MDQPMPLQITPAPSEEEAAALAVVLSAYLAEALAMQPAPILSTSAWAIAGRLASQGRSTSYRRGGQPTWTKSSRES